MFQKLISAIPGWRAAMAAAGFDKTTGIQKSFPPLAAVSHRAIPPLVITRGFTGSLSRRSAPLRSSAAIVSRPNAVSLALRRLRRIGARSGDYPGVFQRLNQAPASLFGYRPGAAAWTCNPTTKFVLGAGLTHLPENQLIPSPGGDLDTQRTS